MGWTGTDFSQYKDRKEAALDGIRDSFEVLKSVMVGSTCYAALRDRKSGSVFAAVILTCLCGYEIRTKTMTEFDGPCQAECPASILKLLSETDQEYALEWRKRCKESINNKKILSGLRYGAQILVDGQVLRKMPPSYQFKTDWYLNTDSGRYTPKRYIKDFKVISEA